MQVFTARVRGGAIVPEDGVTLPEGTTVTVIADGEDDGFETTPDVCGGSACMAGTRIPVWVLEGYRRLGWTEVRILASYPSLRATDLVHAWAYVDAHRQEIDEEIRRNEAA